MTTKPSLGNVYIRGILSVGVPESVEKPNGVVFRCSIRGRRPEIPAWICDRSACARVRVAAGAHANLAALVHRVALRKDRAKCKNSRSRRHHMACCEHDPGRFAECPILDRVGLQHAGILWGRPEHTWFGDVENERCPLDDGGKPRQITVHGHRSRRVLAGIAYPTRHKPGDGPRRLSRGR